MIKGSLKKKERRLGYILNLPSFFIISLILIYPLAESIRISLFDISFMNLEKQSFAGLENYKEVLDDSLFWGSMNNTIFYVLTTLTGIMLLALGMAVLLNEEFKGRKFLRVILILPWAIPPMVKAVCWKWIYQGQFGILNAILRLSGIIDKPIGFLTSTELALPSLALIRIYGATPFAALILLAAIQSIPRELYEVAKVDGAGVWNRFRHVTLPGIKGAFVVVLILETMWGLREFDTIYALTKGGPAGSTSVIAWLVYAYGWIMYDLGRSAALSWILSVVTIVLSIIYLKRIYR